VFPAARSHRYSAIKHSDLCWASPAGARSATRTAAVTEPGRTSCISTTICTH